MKLILTVGLPRSGKTTWARKQGVPMVNPDSIRLALHGKPFIPESEGFVWAIAFVMAKALFLSGHLVVIIDATNTTEKRRNEWVRKFQDCRISFEEFKTSKEECIKRANESGTEFLIPIIERMADNYEAV